MGMIKTMKRYCDVKKVVMKPYDYICHHKENIYHIKTIRFSRSAIVTFYSRNHLSIKTGKIKDGRFLTKKERIISLDGFADVHQGVLLFDKEPYKILKQLNESDIVEVKDSTVHHYKLLSKEEDLIALLD